jgi:NTE family protein
LTGTQYGSLARIVYRRERGGTGCSSIGLLGFSIEAGNVWQTRDDVDAGNLVMAGSLFFGADSPLGRFRRPGWVRAASARSTCSGQDF